MKTQLLKKVLEVIALFFFSAANAQIVYTDVNPDQTYTCYNAIGCSQTYSLDLNNDGITDFQIFTDVNNCPEVSLISLNSNPLNTEKTKLNLNQVIDSNLAWALNDNQNLEKFYGHGCAKLKGAWDTSSDGYLGLKFKIGSQFFYGWARLSVALAGLDYFTIKDYAFNSIANQSILAGDTGSIATGIHHIAGFTSLVISPNSFNHLTRISVTLPQAETVSAVIYDLTGRVIKTLANQMMSTGSHQFIWDAHHENGNTVSPGIYFSSTSITRFFTNRKIDRCEIIIINKETEFSSQEKGEKILVLTLDHWKFKNKNKS